jgi:hypothetical protein
VLIIAVSTVTVELGYTTGVAGIGVGVGVGVGVGAGVEFPGTPGMVVIPSEGVLGEPLALAANTMAVISPASASNPSSPSSNGQHQPLDGASTGVGGGGTYLLLP